MLILSHLPSLQSITNLKNKKKTKRTPFLELSFKETPYDDSIPMIIAEHDCSTPENLAICEGLGTALSK